MTKGRQVIQSMKYSVY